MHLNLINNKFLYRPIFHEAPKNVVTKAKRIKLVRTYKKP